MSVEVMGLKLLACIGWGRSNDVEVGVPSIIDMRVLGARRKENEDQDLSVGGMVCGCPSSWRNT